MKVRRNRQRASALGAAVAAAFAVGCLSVAGPPEVLFWEGIFVSPTAADISGSAVMVANPRNTEAGVFLSGEAGTTVSWLIRTGTCGGSGNSISGPAAFPPVLLPTIGEGTGIAVLNFRVENGTYAVELFTGPEAAGPVMACADLLRTDG